MDFVNGGRGCVLTSLLVIETLNMPMSQFLEGDVPQRKEQVLRHRLVISLIRAFADLGLNLVAEPVEQKGFERSLASTGQGSLHLCMLGLL